MVWITPNIDVWHKYTSSDTAAAPSLPLDLRSWVNIYRISIKTSAQLECSDRMTPAAARVSLTWKWYEIVYEQNFVWGNCLLNQRGPHYHGSRTLTLALSSCGARELRRQKTSQQMWYNYDIVGGAGREKWVQMWDNYCIIVPTHWPDYPVLVRGASRHDQGASSKLVLIIIGPGKTSI